MSKSTEGSFTFTNGAKKTKCRWRGSVKPLKNRTFKIYFDGHLNDDRSVIDLVASINPDQSINVDGSTLNTKNGKTTKVPIHLENYKLDKHQLESLAKIKLSSMSRLQV